LARKSAMLVRKTMSGLAITLHGESPIASTWCANY
jgi:hypothetical protein